MKQKYEIVDVFWKATGREQIEQYDKGKHIYLLILCL